MSGVEVNADLSPISEFMEFCGGLADFFEDSRTLNRITARAAESAKNVFNRYADVYSGNNPSEMGHMYEWGQVGEAEGRLWRIYIGPAYRGSRIVDWDFLESQTPVPTGPEVSGVDSDTRVSEHIYHKKAEMTEMGAPVRISPRTDGGVMAMPFRGSNEMGFTKNTIRTRGPHEMEGAFTELWIERFGIIANETVKEDIIASANRFFKREEKKVAAELSKSDATSGTRVKPRKNTRQMAERDGEAWIDGIAAGTWAERGIEG